MGMKAIEAVRPLLMDGKRAEMTRALKQAGAHRFPVARPGYIVAARNYLREHCGLKLRHRLENFNDPIERRDWLAQEKGIKGLGYKEASHFLRNIGIKGHAILDKHVMRCLHELKVVDKPDPPSGRKSYLEIEDELKRVAGELQIDLDELDLVLWSIKTGEVLK